MKVAYKIAYIALCIVAFIVGINIISLVVQEKVDLSFLILVPLIFKGAQIIAWRIERKWV